MKNESKKCKKISAIRNGNEQKKKIILLLSIYKKNVIINHQELKSQVIST